MKRARELVAGENEGTIMPKAALIEFRNAQTSKLGKLSADPAQRVAMVKHQIRQAMIGNIESVACSFCGSEVALGAEKLCCEPMGEAVETLLCREIEKPQETGTRTKGRAKLIVKPRR